MYDFGQERLEVETWRQIGPLRSGFGCRMQIGVTLYGPRCRLRIPCCQRRLLLDSLIEYACDSPPQEEGIVDSSFRRAMLSLEVPFLPALGPRFLEVSLEIADFLSDLPNLFDHPRLPTA